MAGIQKIIDVVVHGIKLKPNRNTFINKDSLVMGILRKSINLVLAKMKDTFTCT